MADIFAGTQPPAWLVEATRGKPGQLGDIIGLALGGAANAVTEGESFKQGLTEARLNQADPLWKIKLAATMANQQAMTLTKVAQAQNSIALANERTAETAAWMEDAPKLSGWLSATPEQRQDLPEPMATSKTGLTAIQRSRDADTRYFSQKDAQQIRQDNSKIQQENQKRSLDWADAVGASDPETQAKIAELPNQGWVVDGQGRKISPSSGALTLLNDWRKANNLLPFGTKQAEVQKPDAIAVEQERQKGRIEIKGIEAQNKEAFEKQRQEDRMALEDIRNRTKVDIEKMKLSDKDSKTGKVVSEDDFVNRHMNSVFQAMYKESSNPKQALVDADKALRARWRAIHPKTEEKTQTITTPAPSTPTEPAKPATTNAPAANPKDPLGLFGP